MKFKKIEIENFGGISHLTTEPKTINVLIGPNGAGKSTFLRAVKFGLIGSQTKAQLIRDGCAKAHVNIEMDKFNINKAISISGTSVYLNGRKTTQKSLTELLQDEYGSTKDSMKFLTTSEIFEKATGSEFTEFLLNSGLIPLTISVDDFLKVAALTEFIPADIEEELRDLFPASPEKFSLDTIYTVNDTINKELKDIKKEIERLTSIVTQIPMSATCRAIDDIRRDYDAVVAEEANVRSYNDIKNKIDLINVQIANLQSQFDANTATRPVPKARENAEKQIADINASINKTVGYISSFNENNRILKEQLARLNSSKCPLSDKITCTQDKSEIKEEIESTIEDNDMKIASLQQDLNKLRSQLETLRQTVEQYIQQERAYNDKLNLLKQINNLKSAKPELPKMTTVSGDINERKNILNKELEFANQYANAKKAQGVLNSCVSRRDTLITLDRLTSKKGNVKAMILKNLLSTLVTSINDMAKVICPKLLMELTIDAKGNVLIQCKTPSGLQDYGDLSTGEKLLVQFLVMSQINMLSGFKILILDNLDKLDAENFKNLIDFLDDPKITAMYDHIFVAAVNHDDFKDVLSGYSGINVIEFV